MRVGIVSDTHSRYATIARVVEILADRDVDLVLHCGDIEDAETVEFFRDLTTHFVFGNCDTDKQGLRQAMKEIGATLHEPFGNVEVAGCKIAFLHGDDKKLMQDVERSDHFDFLFYGHTHDAKEHQTGKTRVINPGALHRARLKTFLILDLPGCELESVAIG